MEKEGIGTVIFIRIMVLIVIACIASSLQYVARVECGFSGGFIGGAIYKYNMISYFIGLLVFIMGLIAFSSKPSVSIYGNVGIAFLWNIIGSIIMFIALLFVELYSVGIFESMENSILNTWTMLGWPILTFFTMNKFIDSTNFQNDYIYDKKKLNESFTFKDEYMIKFIVKNMLILAVVFVSRVTLLLYCIYKMYKYGKAYYDYLMGDINE